MSATDFYLTKGYTPTYKTVVINASGTTAVWTPTTSTKIVLTGAQIFSNLGAGTFILNFGYQAGTRIMSGCLLGSTFIDSEVHIDSGTSDRVLYFDGTPNGTNAWLVNLQGFEIPM